MHYIYWSQGSLYAVSTDRPLPTLLAVVNDRFANLSPDNNRIAFSNNGLISIYDLISGEVSAITQSISLPKSSAPKWSPDGTQLVYVSRSFDPQKGFADFPSIYVTALADGLTKQLTPWETVEQGPVWSPDGKWIAFASDQGKVNLKEGNFVGATEIYLLHADCIMEPSVCIKNLRQITNIGRNGTSKSPSWSPDSKSLVFVCKNDSEDAPLELCRTDIDGTALLQLTWTNENEAGPIWSPDGKYIAFTREDALTSAGDVFVMPANGGDAINITKTPDEDEYFVFWLIK